MVELLRLFCVLFFAGVGYQASRLVGGDATLLGPFDAVSVGVVVGSGFGYVLGGVVGRSTVAAADQAESSLREVSAESVVAGAIGLMFGVLLGAAVAWPIFFLPQAFLAFPLFGFVVAVLGYVGYQVGQSKRDGVLALFGASTGMGPRRTPTSALPRIVDSSIAIDGRILDVVRAGFLHGTMLVASPVLAELQGLADAGDDTRRAKGRRGLEVLEALRREPGVSVEVLEADVPGVAEVDAKLVRLCLDNGTALLTLDTNLAKAAALAGVAVLNLHALALALRPAVSAGDEVGVLLVKNGKEPGQAVGYLEDGSMVVVERARSRVGGEVEAHVTSVLTTANGRLIFARLASEPADALRPSRPGPRRSTGAA
ncbi:MAG: PIN domain nuclease [Actinomycetota bacterium]|nr:PIN domain nuclease [Actinomycetota bacterium]